MNLERLGLVDAEGAEPRVNVVAPDKDRDAVTAVLECNRGAQDDFLFAFGKDNPPRLRTRAFISQTKHRIGRVHAAAQRLAIGIHVEDRPRRHT